MILEIQTFKVFDILRELMNEFLKAVPNVVGALLIALLGFLFARIFSRFLKKILVKIGIDKIGEKLNDIEVIQKANFNIVPSVVLSKIIYYFLLLIFIIAATDILGMPAVSQLLKDIIDFIPNLITALIVLVLGILLAEFIRNIVQTALNSLGVPSAKLISSFVFYFLFISVAISALTQAQIETDFISANISLIIGGGVFAFALGYGIASKDIVANFLASFYSKDRVHVGDVISIDNVTGEIIAINKSSITLRTGDDMIIIPLKKLTTEKITIHNSIKK